MSRWHWERTRRRQPYGRRPGSRAWVEDARYQAIAIKPYWLLDPQQRALDRERERQWTPGQLDGHGPRVKAVPMPRGGERFLFRCVLCNHWRTRLFNPSSGVLACRVCLGLRYKSQYVTRRVSASAARIQAARTILERAEASLRERLRRCETQRLRREQTMWCARRSRLERAAATYAHRQREAEWREMSRVAAYLDYRLTRKRAS